MTTLVMVCTGDKFQVSCTNIEYQLVNVGDFQRSHVVTSGEGSVYDKLKFLNNVTKKMKTMYTLIWMSLSRIQ